MERDRRRARELAAKFLAAGDPVGWFEQLYQEGDVPWRDLEPSPNLVDFFARTSVPGRTALTIGCGFGDDAELLAARGFETTAFDVAPTAIELCRRRFPST